MTGKESQNNLTYDILMVPSFGISYRVWKQEMCANAEDAVIELESLADGSRPGLTVFGGGCLAEAAIVCLEDQQHSPGAVLRVRGHKEGSYQLQWQAGTGQARRCWNDPEEATEYGACGIAILIAEPIAGFPVIERSPKGTHFDYWLGEPGEDEEEELPFANYRFCLEVSGIRSGDDSKIQTRMKQKLTRLDTGSTTLPTLVIIVEFSNPVSEVERR